MTPADMTCTLRVETTFAHDAVAPPAIVAPPFCTRAVNYQRTRNLTMICTIFSEVVPIATTDEAEVERAVSRKKLASLADFLDDDDDDDEVVPDIEQAGGRKRVECKRNRENIGESNSTSKSPKCRHRLVFNEIRPKKKIRFQSFIPQRDNCSSHQRSRSRKKMIFNTSRSSRKSMASNRWRAHHV